MRRWAYLFGLVLALAFAYDLTRIPVQVSDSLGDILEVQAAPSMAAAFRSGLAVQGFLRPLKAAQTRIVSDMSQGSYTFAYRGVHVVLLVLTVWMFVQVLQVQTATDLAAAAFALTVLLGLHTFANLLREAFPINHFLEIMLFALIALRLAQGRPGWVRDAAATVTFCAAALIVESGLLIWVVLVAAWLSGMRGVSRRGLAVISVLLLGYAYARIAALSTGLPTVDERSSGFLLGVLEPDELRARFGENPWPYFAYNVGASILTVLFAEPRAGVWVTLRAYLESDIWPWMVVAVISSAATTAIIVTGVVSSWRDRAGRDAVDRFFLISAAVLAANAVLTYGFLTRDDLMSLAGAFYALAAYAAVRRLLLRAGGLRPVAAVIVFAALIVASTGWAIRTAGLHYSLRSTAFKTRNDWTTVPDRWSATPEWRVVTERLRQDALERRVVAPRFEPRWITRWFEE